MQGIYIWMDLKNQVLSQENRLGGNKRDSEKTTVFVSMYERRERERETEIEI